MSDRVQLGSFLQDGENFMNNLYKQNLEQSQALTRDIENARNNYNKWESIAKQNGFNSIDDVVNFQRQHGLVADGKVGKNTLAKMQALKDAKVKQQGQQNWTDAMKAAGYKQGTLKDGSVAFSDGKGNTYYNNGRVRSKDGKMSNYDYNNLKSSTAPATSAAPVASTQNYTWSNVSNPNAWRAVGHQKYNITVDGKQYPVMVNKGQDYTYALDPATGKVRPIKESSWVGGALDAFLEGSDWQTPESVVTGNENHFLRGQQAYSKGWKRASGMTDDVENHSDFIEGRRYLTRAYDGSNTKYRGNYAVDPTTKKVRKYVNGKFTGDWMDPNSFESLKRGGIMTKKYQQGGAAPQQDMQQQVVALVQAAMQGDQKATQQVTQIMEAAKAGDQQAAQIAQMIQQVIQQMQGQATAAKWGAKLSYIKSLKYAKGGKTCPACMSEGGNVNKPAKNNTPDTISKKPPMQKPLKKAEPVKSAACGGKAKKRYFGGWL